MTPQSKRIIIDAVRNSMGDDLERANRSFGTMTIAQLDEQWGQSGKTCRTIWDEYKSDRAARTKALQELEALLALEKK